MKEHTLPDGQKAFMLPLSFGFGKVFNGFLGREFTPLKNGSMHSFSVRPRRGEARRLRGLPIFATYKPGGLKDVTDSLKKWLQETLRDKDSMSQWRRACFPEEQDVWVRKLLDTVWKYSCGCWRENNQNSKHHQINETLFYAWCMTLLATILSFQITVPAEGLGGVVNMLRRPQPEYTTSSSRPISKGVKCVLFDIYQKMQQKVMSQLDAIVKNSKTMNDREWGNMYCVSILLIVVINQAQLSLRVNYELAKGEQRGEWEQTKMHLEESEAAFRSLAHSFARLFRKRKGRRSNAGDDDITSSLFSCLDQIQHQHRKGTSNHYFYEVIGRKD